MATINELYFRYHQQQASIQAPATAAAHMQAYRAFAHHCATAHALFFGRATIAALTEDHLKSFQHELQATRASETEHLYTRAILQFLLAVAETHPLGFDPIHLAAVITNARRPKPHNPALPPFAATAELLIYVEAYNPPIPTHLADRSYLRDLRDRALILLLADCGLRVAEVCTLRVAAFNPAAQTLHVITGQFGLPLTTRVTAALQQYLQGRTRATTLPPPSLATPNPPLFARHDKRAGKRSLPISRWTITNILDDWTSRALPPATRADLHRAGQSITATALRAYFIYHALAATPNLHEAQLMARHADPGTTRRYQRAKPADSIRPDHT